MSTGISFLYKEQSAIVSRVHDDLVLIALTKENLNGTYTQVWIKLDEDQVKNLISFLNESK